MKRLQNKMQLKAFKKLEKFLVKVSMDIFKLINKKLWNTIKKPKSMHENYCD